MRRAIGVLVFFATSISTARADDSIQPFSESWLNGPYDNAVYESADHEDGIFVLSIFQNSCGACDANEANVDALATKYASQPRIQVLDLGEDQSDDPVLEWITRHKPNHPVLRDGDRHIAFQLGLEYLPTTVITNCMGAVRYSTVGVWSPETKQAIDEQLARLLAEPCHHSHNDLK